MEHISFLLIRRNRYKKEKINFLEYCLYPRHVVRDGSFAKGVDCLGWAYNNGIIDY